MNNVPNFSERLKELMQEKDNIKTEALGIEIKVSGSTIRKWLRNVSSPSYSQIIKLALFFNCPIDFMVGKIDYYDEFKPKICIPFITRLNQVLHEKHITTYKLSKETGISTSYLSRWKRGEEPHLHSLIELANYLDCGIDYLIGLEN